MSDITSGAYLMRQEKIFASTGHPEIKGRGFLNRSNDYQPPYR
jgi:hypothetical protein